MNGDKVPVKDDNTRQGNEANTHPSSVEQIQSALAKAGLDNPIANLPITSRAQKALDAYIQNNNQTARYQVAQSYSGIDLHVWRLPT